MIHRYCSAVRLLENVHAGRTAVAFTRRPVAILRFRHLRGLPVLVRGMSRRAWGLRLRRAAQQLALSLLFVWPSAQSQRRHPDCKFSKLDTQPICPPVYASLGASRRPAQNSGPSGSLLLSRKALSSSIPCRVYPGARFESLRPCRSENRAGPSVWDSARLHGSQDPTRGPAAPQR